MMPTIGLRQLYLDIYANKLHLTILLRILMPTRGIHKLNYEYGCLQMVLDISTINSYNSFLH